MKVVVPACRIPTRVYVFNFIIHHRPPVFSSMISLRSCTMISNRVATKCIVRGLVSSALPVHSAKLNETPVARYRGIDGQREVIDNFFFRGKALSTSSLHKHRNGVFICLTGTRAVNDRSQMSNESVFRRTSKFSTSIRSLETNAKVKPARFAILETGHASPYTQEAYGSFSKMFIDLLKDADEKWVVYSIIDGHFPSDGELLQYDGFVVTGSRYDAHGTEDWIPMLCEVLQRIHVNKQKVLGVCFGHQVLSRALGGVTGPSNTGWEFGLKEFEVSPALASKPYAIGLPSKIKILGVHRDQVSKVPPLGEILASSPSTPVEIFCVGENVLGIQGHPEFSKDVVEDLLESRVAYGVVSEEVAHRARESMDASDPDREALQRMCKAFLKGTKGT